MLSLPVRSKCNKGWWDQMRMLPGEKNSSDVVERRKKRKKEKKKKNFCCVKEKSGIPIGQ